MKYNSNPLGDITTTVTPVMCECGRLYKDRRDESGKTMCAACYSDCDLETLKKLWGKPISFQCPDCEKTKLKPVMRCGNTEMYWCKKCDVDFLKEYIED